MCLGLVREEAAEVGTAAHVAATLCGPAPPLLTHVNSIPAQRAGQRGTRSEERESPAQAAFGAAAPGLGGGGFSGLSCFFDHEM